MNERANIFMYKVKVNEKCFSVKEGTLLSDALTQHGIYHTHVCGGKGICGKCIAAVNGKKELSCKYEIRSDISVILPDEEKIYTGIDNFSEIKENSEIAFALDIGTTTLALAAVDKKSGKIVSIITDTNPQRMLGADVMSRVDYVTKNGTARMQRLLSERINSMTDAMGAYKASELYASGNTVMLHTLFAEDCSGIGKAPYTPSFLEQRSVNARDIGIKNVREVHSLPCISSFAGADVTAGIYSLSFPEKGKYSILADLGTNAEIALFSEDMILCTSAAAGPCFEGAGISCGMSAQPGALYKYKADGTFSTIENSAVKGICGTGLIDITAVLLGKGIIDETGYMEDERFYLSEDVYLSASDIRQFQLAKSAVYSAIVTLMNKAGCSFDDIESLYISGGFASAVNTHNAAITGLIPKELVKKCRSVGNSSLTGTVKYLLEKGDIKALAEKAQYQDLSSDKFFSEQFIENMMF